MPLIRRYCNAMALRPIRPEVALIVSTYQKPRHLRLSLLSIALQQGVDGKFELIVSDDGSTDETPGVVERFAATVAFPVTFTTHRHGTFQVAQCRNEGVAASSAPYLIFCDGDLILSVDFIAQHLARRRRKSVWSGEYLRLAEDVSAGIDEAAVRSGKYRELVAPAEARRVRQAGRWARWHSLIRHRYLPRLVGGNVGIWRSDYERVNGYDETFRGWGGEDWDLSHRLRRTGTRLRSIIRWTCPCHIWHPRDPTATSAQSVAANNAYLLRGHRQYRCLNGLIKLGPAAGAGELEPLSPERITAIPLDSARSHTADRRRAA